MKSNYVPILNQMADLLQQIADVAGENARTMVKEGEYAQTSAIIVIMLIMALSIMAAALLGIYISNSIRKPVKEIEDAAVQLANGKLDGVHVTYMSRDELGQMSDSIRDLISYQKTIIEDISDILGDTNALMSLYATDGSGKKDWCASCTGNTESEWLSVTTSV